jgi:hypothetical protein
MSVGDWIAVVAVSITALGGITGIVQFLVKHYLAELKPNHGTSMRDELTALSKRVDDIYKILLNKTLS